ncbi:MAG: hypothetical protein ACREJ2_01315 [Planctomycetota bacterium]
MKSTDTETALIDPATRASLLAEVTALRDNPRREPAKLERLARSLKPYAKNWLIDSAGPAGQAGPSEHSAADDAFLARLVATLLHMRTTHAFLLKQDGFDNKSACIAALANLIVASQTDAWEAWDNIHDRRVHGSDEWLSAVLRGLFCFHWTWPRAHRTAPTLFRIDRPRDLPAIFDRVLEHYDLFVTELQKLQGERRALKDVSAAELADCIERLIRLREKFPHTTQIRKRMQFAPPTALRGGRR